MTEKERFAKWIDSIFSDAYAWDDERFYDDDGEEDYDYQEMASEVFHAIEKASMKMSE